MIKLITRFKSNIANFGVYLLAAIIPMLLSLVSNPFIAKNMSPEDYAITGYYGAFTTLFTPLVTFYLLHYYTKRFYELNDADRKVLKDTLFKSLIFFSAFLSLISLLILGVYKSVFNSDSKIAFFPYAAISIFSLPLTGIYSLTLTEYRMKRESKKFFRLSVTNGLLGVILAIVLVVLFKFGAIGRLSATFLASAAVFMYILYKNQDVWTSNFSREIFMTSVKFCFPLVIAAMLTFFCTGYDKVLLEREGDLYSLGIYSVGVTIASYLNVFSTSINDTFQPDIFESIVKRNFRRCFKFIVMKLSIMSTIVLLFSIFAPFIVSLLTYGRYDSSSPFAIIVSISSITSMLYYSISQVTIALGYTKITLTNKIIGSILSIISFHVLISNFGVYGAAWCIVLSYIYFFTGNLILVLFEYKRNNKIK